MFLVLTVLVAACADGVSHSGPPPAERTGWECAGHPVHPDRLVSGPPATALGERGRAALRGEEVGEIDDLASWTIVEESEHRVVLVRELDRPEELDAGDVRTHQLIAVERFGPADADGRPGWHLRTSGLCSPRRELGELGPADVVLGDDLDPTAARLPLLVTERACASGQTAQGRVRVVELDESDRVIGFVLGVEPLRGDQTCESNPATPIALELDAPLGDRLVEERSVHPARRLR